MATDDRGDTTDETVGRIVAAMKGEEYESGESAVGDPTPTTVGSLVSDVPGETGGPVSRGFASDRPTTDWLITGSRDGQSKYWWQFVGPFPSLEAAEKVRRAMPNADDHITFEMTPVATYAPADTHDLPRVQPGDNTTGHGERPGSSPVSGAAPPADTPWKPTHHSSEEYRMTGDRIEFRPADTHSPGEKRRATMLSTYDFAALADAVSSVDEAFPEGFGTYLVGSAVTSADYRDVDVRLILSDEDFDRMFSGRVVLWQVICRSITAWLRDVTKLPVDFQIQRQTQANEKYPQAEGHQRHSLGSRRHRFAGNGDATNFYGSAAEPAGSAPSRSEDQS